ncbi:MAG: hypothetical protein V3W36_05210 [Acidimicrobiia bacterium]|jgi:hypothetical protein
MAEFDVGAFLERFAGRAEAVKERGIPPLEGDARRTFMASAQQDFTDYSLVAEASWELEDGALVLRIPLAPSES